MARSPGRLSRGVPRAGFLALVALAGGALLVSGCGRDPDRTGVPGAAEDTTRKPMPLPGQQRLCDQRFAGIRVEVRAPDGSPVTDARVEVRRASDGAVVRVLERAIDRRGGYIVLDDATPGPVTPGVAFLVTARHGSRRADARLVVGADAAGCHVRLLEGPDVLVPK